MNTDLQVALRALGVSKMFSVAHGSTQIEGQGDLLTVRSPIDGSTLVEITTASLQQTHVAISEAVQAFRAWRLIPAPKRGEVVRRFGEELRRNKEHLASVVTWECGKIYQESLGEVQEMIDVCDFAVGLSRQLYGLTIASERPEHRLMEQWHPLGPIGVISAFNFPVAVWAWNSALALVCGDPVIWKPSEQTPLCAMACHNLLMRVAQDVAGVPDAISCLAIGGASVGEALAAHPQVPLISATGSIPMGRSVAKAVAARLGKSLLELGGNNAMILTPSADLELAIRAIVFAAVGTCGQRCTSLRRLIVHDSIANSVVDRLKKIYSELPIGNPFEESTLVGPLISEAAFDQMQKSIASASENGSLIFGGERVATNVPEGGVYVVPALVQISPEAEILHQETFAPLLYVIRYHHFDEAIEIQNGVPQGLASAVFTSDVREAELFCSPAGSDCGIANVNIGTSGAEIGGAFGGEKETGGGRESGSDAWKAYMRRATNTINYSTALPLAQGIRFEL